MKKTISILVILAGLLCFAACSAGGESDTSDAPFEVDGLGVNDIVAFDLPEGYEGTDTTQNGSPNSEILQQNWSNGETNLCLSMLSYKGEGVMGMDGSLEDYVEDTEFIDVIALDNPQPDAYISYADGTAQDGSAIEKYSLEAVFSYEDYVLDLDMSNEDGQPITEEQKDTFYQVLKSAKFAAEGTEE